MKNLTYEFNPVSLGDDEEYDPEVAVSDEDADNDNGSQSILDKNDIADNDKNDSQGISERKDVFEKTEKVNEEDMESDEEIRGHLIKFPQHAELLIKFRNAKISAAKNKKRAYVCWRGHKTSLSPNDPAMTYEKFEKHLVTALKKVKDITAAEEKVVKPKN